VAKDFPEVKVDDFIVDAMMAHVVRNPARFDVIVTTNMFGDILSDLTAELSGSLGLGGSLNAGQDHAMGQAAHGSAPDIAGQDIANPFSLVLSAAMLLRWHSQKLACMHLPTQPPPLKKPLSNVWLRAFLRAMWAAGWVLKPLAMPSLHNC